MRTTQNIIKSDYAILDERTRTAHDYAYLIRHN